MTDHEKELIDLLCPAIQNKRLVRFWYLNVTNGIRDWRTVEPYIIGALPRKNISLSAWFIPTTEQGMVGQKANWRTYILKNISDLQILNENFTVYRSDYDPTGYGMKDIYCAAEKQKQGFMRIDP